jgi:hypothetical protein
MFSGHARGAAALSAHTPQLLAVISECHLAYSRTPFELGRRSIEQAKLLHRKTNIEEGGRNLRSAEPTAGYLLSPHPHRQQVDSRRFPVSEFQI